MADPTILPYDLSFEQRAGYLYARVQASTITEQMARSYLRKVADKCHELASTRLLLHRDIPAMLPMGTLFFIAAEFQEMIGDIKTAFVNPYSANQNQLEFGITVGMNRGGDYGVFTSDAAAEAWLLK